MIFKKTTSLIIGILDKPNLSAKLFILIFFLAMGFSAKAQFNVDYNQYAWERTSYQRWNKWKPFIYYEVINRKYKKEDRRTMPVRARQMMLWAIYSDQYKLAQIEVDSTYRSETRIALDKALNKNYLILQRSRVLDSYENIEGKLDNLLTLGISDAFFDALFERYGTLQNNVAFIKKAYVEDGEKYPLIETEIEGLKSFDDLLGVIFNLFEMPELNNEQIWIDIGEAINEEKDLIQQIMIKD